MGEEEWYVYHLYDHIMEENGKKCVMSQTRLDQTRKFQYSWYEVLQLIRQPVHWQDDPVRHRVQRMW